MRSTTTGSASSALASMTVWVPLRAWAIATALARSAGTSTEPNAASVCGSTDSTRAPSGTVVLPSTTRSSSKGSKNWRSAGSGLKRQSSSRLDGASKASGSREVKRSAGEPVG